MKIFAQMGVLIAFAKDYWEASLEAKGREARERRRRAYKHLNAHNDKLGVDFDNVGHRYVAQFPVGSQFKISKYDKFLEEAAVRLKGSGIPNAQIMHDWFSYLSK